MNQIVLEQEIRKLIDTYEQLLHDHKVPIDRTTREQYRVEGGDARLMHVINDLKCILYRNRTGEELTLKEKLAFTE